MIIKVCDASMGRGKSSAIVGELNNNPAVKHLIVVPYKKENNRFVANTNCVTPDDDEKSTKSKDIIKLIDEQQTNIVCCHALFERFDDKTLEALKDKHYNLVIDEIPNLIEAINLNSVTDYDIKALTEQGKISVENSQIRWISESSPRTAAEISIYKELKTRDLYVYNNNIIISMTRLKTFSVFESVMFCTYRFDYSMLDYYCQLHKIDIENYYISQSDNMITLKSNDGEYTINEKIFIKGKRLFNQPVGVERIDVYTGDKYIPETNNKSGVEWLGYSHYQKAITVKINARNKEYEYKLNDKFKKIRESANNYVRTLKRQLGNKPSDIVMWTCFGSKDDHKNLINYKHAIKCPNLPLKSFIPCNTVASNDYEDCIIVVCLCGVFLNPNIVNFLNAKGVVVDVDEYSLSMFLQLLWRSNLRVEDSKETVYVYIASQKVRVNFVKWLKEAQAQKQIEDFLFHGADID